MGIAGDDRDGIMAACSDVSQDVGAACSVSGAVSGGDVSIFAIEGSSFTGSDISNALLAPHSGRGRARRNTDIVTRVFLERGGDTYLPHRDLPGIVVILQL